MAPAPDPEPQTAWEYTCEQLENISDYTCEGLESPIVVITRATEVMYGVGVNGLHVTGEKYIFVHPSRVKAGTIEHEMTHYIVHANQEDVTICEHERLARFVAGQPWGPDEKARYMGCSDVS